MSMHFDIPVAPICPNEFIQMVGPSLSNGKLEEVLLNARTRWSPSQILSLLKDPSPDVRKVAALALSLLGDKIAVVPLAMALHDADPMVSQIAEHALWSVWFRMGSSAAVQYTKCGNTHVHHGNYACAIEKFTQAIGEDPSFAEAYNQRAIASYLSERYTESIADCQQAISLMPQHFGAMAGMAHCYAHLGRLADAKKAYRLALAIHPHLDGIQASLEQIEELLKPLPPDSN